MADQEFSFEAEFSLLDIGATSSLLRAGSVRPTVLAFSQAAGVEAVSLRRDDDRGVAAAFEEARRYVRDLQPAAYGVVAHVASNGGDSVYRVVKTDSDEANADFLALAMASRGGEVRSVLYPIRRAAGRVTLGPPNVEEIGWPAWHPIGDLWYNPFCEGDTVRFRPRERAVDPASPLWQTIVDLTRLRIQEDQSNADEYMAFLDDLRNGVFVVSGRASDSVTEVLLRPRSVFNPLGTLRVDAGRLTLDDAVAAEVDKVAAR